jgi:Cu2+-containing amine oxidase
LGEWRCILDLKWNGKINQILAYVKNQEKESKVIKQIVELHKQEMAEIRKSTDALGLKFDRMSEIVTEIMNDYGQVKQAIKEWEKCYQQWKKHYDTWMKREGKIT